MGPEVDNMKVVIDHSNMVLIGQFKTRSPVSSAMIRSGGCKFGNMFVTNSAEEVWLMVFDTEKPPSPGSFPEFRVPLKSGDMFSITGLIHMRYGLFVAASRSVMTLDQEGVGRGLHIFCQIF